MYTNSAGFHLRGKRNFFLLYLLMQMEKFNWKLCASLHAKVNVENATQNAKRQGFPVSTVSQMAPGALFIQIKQHGV